MLTVLINGELLTNRGNTVGQANKKKQNKMFRKKFHGYRLERH